MKVKKTIKLFIGGKFPRTESGRSFPQYMKDGKTIHSELCQSSRKDFRNTVEIAKKAHPGWNSRTAFNRSQILYRMAEMAEGKRAEFETLLKEVLGYTPKKATDEVSAAIDTFVYYAGFCDKYQQLVGAVNPVNMPYHNFTQTDSIGVTTLICDDKFSFAKLIDDICSLITGGNSVVVLLGKEAPAILAPLAEVFATSDLPGGVVNLLTGHLDELKDIIATHREVRAISFQNKNQKKFFEMKELGTDNMKRIIPYSKKTKSLDLILNGLEYKTVWHPIGQ